MRRAQRNLYGWAVAALLVGLGGCASDVRNCQAVPDNQVKLEYPLGLTWYNQTIVVASANSRGIYCSAYLTIFSRQREQRALVPLVLDEKEYSLLGELRADPRRGFLYTTDRLEDSLLVFQMEGEGLRFIRAIPISGESSEEGRGGSDPFGLDVNPVDGTVAVTAPGTGEVIFFTSGAEKEIGRVYIGSNYPLRVRFNPAGNQAWVTADTGNYVYLLSLSPPALQTYFYGVSPGTTPIMRGRALWVGEEGALVAAGSPQSVLFFNPSSGLEEAIPLGEGMYPFDLEIFGSHLYLSSLKRNEIWVLDRDRKETIKVINTLQTEGEEEHGNGPSEIVIGPEPGQALVLNFQSGDITVLDLEKMTVESYWKPGEQTLKE